MLPIWLPFPVVLKKWCSAYLEAETIKHYNDY